MTVLQLLQRQANECLESNKDKINLYLQNTPNILGLSLDIKLVVHTDEMHVEIGLGTKE